MADPEIRKFARRGILDMVERIETLMAGGRRPQAMEASLHLGRVVKEYLLLEEQSDGVDDAFSFAQEPATARMSTLPDFGAVTR